MRKWAGAGCPGHISCYPLCTSKVGSHCCSTQSDALSVAHLSSYNQGESFSFV
jgi:hypothetical protein